MIANTMEESYANGVAPSESQTRDSIFRLALPELYDEIARNYDKSTTALEGRNNKPFVVLGKALGALRREKVVLDGEMKLNDVLPTEIHNQLTLEECLSLTVDFGFMGSRCVGFKEVHTSRKYARKDGVWFDDNKLTPFLRTVLYSYNKMSDGFCPECVKFAYSSYQ